MLNTAFSPCSFFNLLSTKDSHTDAVCKKHRSVSYRSLTSPLLVRTHLPKRSCCAVKRQPPANFTSDRNLNKDTAAFFQNPFLA
uniref:Uncharacterized protein n=1 Tax=Anguilla anguilla TaxID=7936 RepID=A0A0E9W908_ANGAN